MSTTTIKPTGREAVFRPDELIVSKTDVKGRLTYCNDVFIRVSGYDEDQLLGAPHSIIRHPDMPRCVFKLLWDRIEAKREIFAYVVNMARNGDHYWVLAHVTPSLAPDGTVLGYHSSRRKPNAAAVSAVETLYRDLRSVEEGFANRKDGMQAGLRRLNDVLAQKGCDYDRFVLAL